MNWTFNNNNGASGRAIMLSVLAAVLLSGCQHPTETRSATTVTPRGTVSREPTVAQPVNPPVSGPVNSCQRELAALAKINPQAYAAKKSMFDSLLNNAAIYTSVRGQINEQTQGAMDALYKYKVQQVCSEIQYSVMQGLMSRGENLK